MKARKPSPPSSPENLKALVEACGPTPHFMEGKAESQTGVVTCLRGQSSSDVTELGIEPTQLSRHQVPFPLFHVPGLGPGAEKRAAGSSRAGGLPVPVPAGSHQTLMLVCRAPVAYPGLGQVPAMSTGSPT